MLSDYLGGAVTVIFLKMRILFFNRLMSYKSER